MELIIGALIGIVLFITIGYCISPYFPSKCITTKQELYSFNNSNDYYLINNKDENIYYYTIKNKEEKIVKKSIISSKNIKIKESNNPILIETKKEFKKKWYKWFAIEDSYSKKYEFYIPSNTILYIQKD